MNTGMEVFGFCVAALVTKIIACAIKDSVQYWVWKFRNR